MKSPIYTVRPTQLARSAAAALAGGIAMGLIWGFVLLPFTFGLFSIFLGAGLGYAFTRLLEVASGRKRGPVMIGLAIAGIALAWGIMAVLVPWRLAAYGLVAAAVGVYFAWQNLR
jgi:hypothetical protein